METKKAQHLVRTNSTETLELDPHSAILDAAKSTETVQTLLHASVRTRMNLQCVILELTSISYTAQLHRISQVRGTPQLAHPTDLSNRLLFSEKCFDREGLFSLTNKYRPSAGPSTGATTGTGDNIPKPIKGVSLRRGRHAAADQFLDWLVWILQRSR